MLEGLRRWLSGTFICDRCGRTFHVMTFGFGTAICPDCYDGEQPFLYFDKSFLLNRLLLRILKRESRVMVELAGGDKTVWCAHR